MTYTTDTSLRGTTTITADQAIAIATARGAKGNYVAYIRELWNLCERYGLNADVLFAQWLEETNNGSSDLWLEGNPVGIGIFGPGAANPLQDVTGEESARVHVAEMLLKMTGTLPDELADVERYDSHLARVKTFVARPDWPFPRTLNDLRARVPGTADDYVWAADQQYAVNIAAILNAVAGATGQQGGTVSTPKIYDIRHDDDAKRFGLSVVGSSKHSTLSERDYLLRRCFPDRLGAEIRFIYLHTQDGRTVGSLDWWVNGTSDNGQPIQASATVMANQDGSLLRCIPEKDGPWTNGDVQSPTLKSLPLRQLGGNPNNWCVTLEAEDLGQPAKMLPDAELEAIIWFCKDAMHRIPTIRGVANVGLHKWINSVTRSGCPGPYGDHVLEVLAKEDVPVVPIEPADPEKIALPDGMRLSHARRLFGSMVAYGHTYAFNPNGPASQEWIERGIASIPKGGHWEDGNWPLLTEVVGEGKQAHDGLLLVFSDGSIIRRPGLKQAA